MMRHSDTRLEQAQQAVREGRIDDAKALISSVLEAEPSNSRAWIALADATEDVGQAAQYRAKAAVLRKVDAQSPADSTPPKKYAYPKETSYTRVIGGCLLGLGTFVAIFFAVIWLFKEDRKSSLSQTAEPLFVSRVNVVYSITGTTGSRIYLIYNAGVRNEETLVEIPWSVSLSVRPGSELHISAQSLDVETEVTCLITVDGQPIQEVTSTGDTAIATCSGVAP